MREHWKPCLPIISSSNGRAHKQIVLFKLSLAVPNSLSLSLVHRPSRNSAKSFGAAAFDALQRAARRKMPSQRQQPPENKRLGKVEIKRFWEDALHTKSSESTEASNLLAALPSSAPTKGGWLSRLTRCYQSICHGLMEEVGGGPVALCCTHWLVCQLRSDRGGRSPLVRGEVNAKYLYDLILRRAYSEGTEKLVLFCRADAIREKPRKKQILKCFD